MADYGYLLAFRILDSRILSLSERQEKMTTSNPDFDRKLNGPRAKSDGKFEMVHVGGVGWITRCKRTKRQVEIVGNRVRYIPRDKQIQT